MERTLLSNDMLAVRRWFIRQRGSKLAVIAGFMLVVLLTAVGSFSIGLVYFRNLTGFGIYGQATAAYLLHAAILVTSFLAVGSAAASTLSFLFAKNRGIEYLKALPIDDGVILRWLLIKSSVVSISLLSVLMIPVLVSYAVGMKQILTPEYILRSLLLIASLVIICQSIGSLVAFIIIPFIKQRTRYIFVAAIFCMLFAVLILLKVIFPTGLIQLYFADTDKFWQIYNGLPLSNSYLPTLWLTLIVVSKDMLPVFASVGFALFIGALSYVYQRAAYTRIYQEIHAAPFAHNNSTVAGKAVAFRRIDPLIMKDILSVVRTPSEASYVLFLIGLAAFFFLLILYTGSFRYVHGNLWSPGLITFSLGWLLFFTTSFLLRLVFPLMARECSQSWYMFTLPLAASRLVISKVTASLVVSMVFMIFAVVLWLVVPIGMLYKMILILWSVWSIGVLVLIHAAFGMIRPNFEDGTDPEKVSTSSQGMAALALSMLVTGGVCYVVYAQLSYGSVPLMSWLFFFILSVGLPWYLLMKAYRSVKEYQF